MCTQRADYSRHGNMPPPPQCTCWLRHLLILSSGGPWQRRRGALPALTQPLWFLPNLKEPVCVLLYTTGSFQNSMCVFFSFCWCLSDVSALVFLRYHLRLPPGHTLLSCLHCPHRLEQRVPSRRHNDADRFPPAGQPGTPLWQAMPLLMIAGAV